VLLSKVFADAKHIRRVVADDLVVDDVFVIRVAAPRPAIEDETICVGLDQFYHVLVVRICRDILGIGNSRLPAHLPRQKIEPARLFAKRHVVSQMRSQLLQFSASRPLDRGSEPLPSPLALTGPDEMIPARREAAGLNCFGDVAVLREITTFIEVLGRRFDAQMDRLDGHAHFPEASAKQ
jgi:hypothetical protein